MENPVRKKKPRKEKPSTSENNDSATQSNESILDSSTYLTYDILRIVFQYLNARDLASAARVCRSWLEAVNNEKWTRGPCCFIRCYEQFVDILNVANLRIKPSAGFFFIPENTPRDVEEHIETLLPGHCQIIILYSGDIIMDKEMEDPYPNIVCAFLPQIPNVRIKSFKVAQHSSIQNTAEYREIMSTIVNRETSVSNHETCFMLFCNLKGRTTAKRWARAIQKSKENEIVSVWGGVLEDLYAQHIENDDSLYKRQTRHRIIHRMDIPSCVAVLITGSIQTWSIVLQNRTKEQAEAKLKLFKNEVKLKKHSIGFMFMCIARGNEMYNETNVESTIFKRLFPKVPLVGCSGYGEFGKSTIVDEVNKEKNIEECKCKRSKSWSNEFSTVFLILTYG
ncbi:PREDICTED: F-box only protein 22-like [Trachymyrmex cornetzi]|uniref:F-box only protein 22-like n=1 Tax=Trachymyrmex cornetzi TaxID=471704 RepID=UPI00084F4221|nr:PREDICTED: F-box only protein 22-like [Trachymyrmex cornetzi]